MSISGYLKLSGLRIVYKSPLKANPLGCNEEAVLFYIFPVIFLIIRINATCVAKFPRDINSGRFFPSLAD